MEEALDGENEEMLAQYFKQAVDEDAEVEHNNNEEELKYQDPETGAHFEFGDLCSRLITMSKKREHIDNAIQLEEMQKHNEEKKL